MLREQVETLLLADTGTKIHRSIIFSLRPIEGWWSYKDAWRLLPAPPEAPRPQVSYAEHPAVLEIRVAHSSDPLIQNLRSRRQTDEICLLLSLLLDGGITWPSLQARHEWVLVHDNGATESTWAQVGYHVPDFVGLADDFSDVSTLAPLAEVSQQEYFSRHGVTMEPMDIPANLALHFEAYDNLPVGDQERFLRACRWRYSATRAWSVAQSMHYIALVSAIQTLVEESQSAQACPTCGKTMGPGPTARFRDFVEHYAPGPQTARERSALYALRSAITHGGKLLMGDTRIGFGGLHPSQVAEWQKSGDLSGIVRIALTNWLAEKGSVSQ